MVITLMRMKPLRYAVRILPVKSLKRLSMIGHNFVKNGHSRVITALLSSSIDTKIIGVVHKLVGDDLNDSLNFHWLCEIPLGTSIEMRNQMGVDSVDIDFHRHIEDKEIILAQFVEFINATKITNIIIDPDTFEIVVSTDIKPSMDPYKLGTIVYDARRALQNLGNAIGSQQYIGKIITCTQSLNTYRYGIQFLDRFVVLPHNQILPANDFFDNCNYNAYTSTVDCNALFFKGQKFLLRNGYLYNKDSSVVLDYKKFNKLFKLIEDEAAI
jgi:hypothetical protein